jgi:hypothetical protein
MIATTHELSRYRLEVSEWETLAAYVNILRVSRYSFYLPPLNSQGLFKVPHAFQQLLSYEKIPTLYQALPHFHRMVAAWERKRELMPRYENVIDAGIKKLQDYLDNIEGIPAYTLAIRTFSS